MLRDFFKTIGGFSVYLLAFFIPAVLLVLWAQHNYFAALDTDSSERISFIVQDDWTLAQLSQALEDKGIIRNADSLTFMSKYKLSEEERESIQIPPGEYELSPSMKPAQIFSKLLKGDVLLYQVRIPPGQTIDQVATLLAQSGLVSSEEANAAIRNRNLMATLGVPSYIPEGFFIEGAYEVTKPSKATELIASLLEQAEERMETLVPNWRNRSKTLGFQPYEILKIASIIEKEAEIDEEKRVISSLFHNRIRIGLPLQSDAALLYDKPALAVQGITDEARKEAGPYNTFTSTDLPLTPICSPGVASIEAALTPLDTDFLYMVAKGDGTHDFSMRLSEHLKKIREYRALLLSTE